MEPIPYSDPRLPSFINRLAICVPCRSCWATPRLKQRRAIWASMSKTHCNWRRRRRYRRCGEGDGVGAGRNDRNLIVDAKTRPSASGPITAIHQYQIPSAKPSFGGQRDGCPETVLAMAIRTNCLSDGFPDTALVTMSAYVTFTRTPKRPPWSAKRSARHRYLLTVRCRNARRWAGQLPCRRRPFLQR